MDVKACVKKALLYPTFLGNLKRLKNNTSRIILLDTPRHGNLGDQAISLAEISFLKTYFKEKDIVEFTYNELYFFFENIKKVINDNDIICIQGGGFIGSIWPNEHAMFEKIINDFSKNSIFVFPQTAYFDSRQDLKTKKFIDTIHKCSKLTIGCRDQNTYDILFDLFGSNNKIILVPDIVTFLKPNSSFDREGILFCFRNDKEKIVDDSEIKRIESLTSQFNENIKKTDTVISDFNFRKRKKAVYDKLAEFSSSRLVITDRLHGMLMAAITGTPCIALDNLSKKVSGVYRWIKYLDYVTCVSINNIDANLIQKYLLIDKCQYSNEPLMLYYRKMVDIIKGDNKFE